MRILAISVCTFCRVFAETFVERLGWDRLLLRRELLLLTWSMLVVSVLKALRRKVLVLHWIKAKGLVVLVESASIEIAVIAIVHLKA